MPSALASEPLTEAFRLDTIAHVARGLAETRKAYYHALPQNRREALDYCVLVVWNNFLQDYSK